MRLAGFHLGARPIAGLQLFQSFEEASDIFRLRGVNYIQVKGVERRSLEHGAYCADYNEIYFVAGQ